MRACELRRGLDHEHVFLHRCKAIIDQPRHASSSASTSCAFETWLRDSTAVASHQSAMLSPNASAMAFALAATPALGKALTLKAVQKTPQRQTT